MTDHPDYAAEAAALTAAMPPEVQRLAVAALRRMSERNPYTGPFGWMLGITFERREPGLVACSLVVEEGLYNPARIAHGGVLYSLVDSAAGGAVYTLLDRETEGCVTAELKVNYLRPAIAGRITATATVVNRGRKLAVVTAEVHDSAGQLLGVALGTFAITARPKV